MSRSKKIKVSPEVQEESIKKIEEAAEEELKKRKQKSIFSEVGSFLIIIVIIALLGFSTYYWYDNYYDSAKKYEVKDKNAESESQDYELLSYKTENTYQLLNDEYYIETDGESVKQIVTKKGETIFDSEKYVNHAFIGSDNNLYLYLKEQGDYANKINIYKLKNNTWEEIKTLGQVDIYYKEVIYQNDSREYLLGFYGESTDNEKNELYLLNDESISLEDYQLLSSKQSKEYIYTISKDHLIIKNQDSIKVFNVSTKDTFLEEDYLSLKNDFQDNFIAKKEEKWGIIDENQRILIPFDYNYISLADEIYCLYKEDTLTFMDKDFKKIADIPLNTVLNPSDFSKINIFKLEDNYYYTNQITSENYLITKNGTTKKVEDNLKYDQQNTLLYQENSSKRLYTFYNANGEEKYSIDLSLYDTKKVSFENYQNKYLIANVGKNKLYYDITSGEKFESLESFIYEIGNIKLTYNYKDEVKISDGQDTITIKTSYNFADSFIINQDKTFTFANDKELFIIIPKK